MKTRRKTLFLLSASIRRERFSFSLHSLDLLKTSLRKREAVYEKFIRSFCCFLLQYFSVFVFLFNRKRAKILQTHLRKTRDRKLLPCLRYFHWQNEKTSVLSLICLRVKCDMAKHEVENFRCWTLLISSRRVSVKAKKKVWKIAMGISQK